MKNIINWIIGLGGFMMIITFWGLGLSFDDSEVRGIFTLVAVNMIIIECVVITVNMARNMKIEWDT